MTTFQRYGLIVLRIGLSILYLWFGFSQLLDGADWISWVPAWAVTLTHLQPLVIVHLNGLFELVMGTLLVTGLWVRPVALLLSAHLALVTFDIGLTAIGMRDLALTAATFALGMLTEEDNAEKTVDSGN